MLKALFYILIVIAAVVAVYIYILVIISKVYFKFDLGGIQIPQLTGASIILKINAFVQNDNGFRITFSDLFVQLFKDNELIATSVKVDDNKYTLPPEGKMQFQQDIQLNVNPKTISVVTDYIQKRPVVIDYIVNVKIFGIKVPPIEDSFTLQ